MISGFGAGPGGKRSGKKKRVAKVYRAMADMALQYQPQKDGKLANVTLRDQLTQNEMDTICFTLSTKRAGEEAKAGAGPGHTASMFKWYATELNKRRQELIMTSLGSKALGWEGEGFEPHELAQDARLAPVRRAIRSRAERRKCR